MKLNLGAGPDPLEGFVNLDKADGWSFESGLQGYDDGSVDAVTISHALMYVDESHWPIVFAEIERVLKVGGVVRITEDATDDPESERFGGHFEAVTLTTPAKIAGYLELVGLSPIEQTPETTSWRDDSLIQRRHGEPPKVFHVEGAKRSPLTLDLLYVAWNRQAFTRKTFELLLENTNWNLVRRLHVYDDGSTDGTRELLGDWIHRTPIADFALHETNGLGPVGVMADYLEHYALGSDVFAKVDNDICVPPGWLDRAVDVMRAQTMLELLGLAAGWPDNFTTEEAKAGYAACSHIGGVGLMRTKAFRKDRPLFWEGRQGFTQWQQAHEPVRGWIVPDVKAVQLDLVPAKPWEDLTEFYIANAWNREWPKYGSTKIWGWIP